MRQIVLILFILNCFQASGQAADSVRTKRFFAYPSVFYTPETKLGLGGAGTYVIGSKKDTSGAFPSQVSFGLAYTTNGQLLIYAPFRLYLLRGNLVMYGEAGTYKFVYNYYGTGNQVPDDYFEKFKTGYSRLRMNVLYKISPNILAGPRLWFEEHRILERKSMGLLDTTGIAGSNGARVVGLGLSVNVDTRDRLFFPGRGIFAELAWQAFHPRWGNTSSWSRWLADVSMYRTLPWKTVLAINGIVDVHRGETPFMLLAGLGGGKRMRGYYENRFRDNNAALLQAEFRKMLSPRFGLTVFASGGKVFNNFDGFGPAPFRLAAGTGLRISIDKREQLNLRLDAAFGRNSQAFYILIGEAF